MTVVTLDIGSILELNGENFEKLVAINPLSHPMQINGDLYLP